MRRQTTRRPRALYPVLVACTLFVLCVAWTGSSLADAHAYAQPDSDQADVAVDPTSQDEGFSAVLYNNKSGLPTSEANAIVETSEGFIWIGSYSGLIRYDGNSFERMDSTTGVTSVVSLLQDSQDRLWIGTNDNGVAVMHKGTLRFYNHDDGLKSLSARTIAEGEDGTIYVGTTRGIVYVGADEQAKAIDDERVADVYVRSLKAGPQNIIYGLTVTNDVFTIEDGRIKDFFTPGELGVADAVSLLPDAERPGYLYVGTEGSTIYRANLGTGFDHPQKIDVDPLTYVKDMEQFGDRLWVCADTGIAAVDADGSVHVVEDLPLTSSIDHVMCDTYGNLWFTSSRQGVMKVVPNQFADVFGRFGLPEAVVNTTCMLDGELFIGTDTGLIVVDDEGGVDKIALSSAKSASGKDLGSRDLVAMLDGVRIRSIIRDSADRLWLSTYSDLGLVRYDHGKVVSFSADDGMPSNRVRVVHERRNGGMLVACTGGLAIVEGDEVAVTYNEGNNVTNTEILTVTEAKNGDVVLGSDGDGIYVIEGTRRTHYTLHVGRDRGLESDVVMRVKYDEARDIFWIVTSNSLAYMDASYHVTTIKQFPYSNNFDLYENTSGEMWVLSSNGIYVVKTDDLLANGTIAPVFYGLDNGLPCLTTANSYSELTDGGELYLAGSTGVAKVNIDVPFETVDDIKMAVPFVEADGIPIYADEEGTIEVPAGVQKLTVYPFVYTYSLLNPQVTYNLEGFEEGKTTVRSSELGPVDYTNLSGGTYEFSMQIKDAMGHGNKELETTIVKPAAFTETWVFRLLVVVGVALVVGLLVRLRYMRKTAELLKKEEENKLFIREMTQAFAKTIDMKDAYTNGHSTRVADYTRMLTEELGYDEETVDRYYNIALLHDIGKIGIPAEVLNKPGKLTDEEFAIIKSHASLGYRALKDISIMPELAVGAWAHHERPDGRGYPRGLTQDEIPRVAQIIAVADTFDAMYSDRPYRRRMNFDKAVSIIREVRGTQLTPDVVDAFLRLVDKGEFRAPDDVGGGSTEDIDNIHRKQDGV